jgi:hypothetical protein
MGSSEVVVDRDVVTAAFGALSAAFEMFTALPGEASTNPERLAALEHLETLERRLPALRHRAINLLAEQASPRRTGWYLVGGRAGAPVADQPRGGASAH